MPSCTCGRRGTHASWCPVNQATIPNRPIVFICNCKLPCQCKDRVGENERLCRFCRTGRHIRPDRNGRMRRDPVAAQHRPQQQANPGPKRRNQQQRSRNPRHQNYQPQRQPSAPQPEQQRPAPAPAQQGNGCLIPILVIAGVTAAGITLLKSITG